LAVVVVVVVVAVVAVVAPPAPHRPCNSLRRRRGLQSHWVRASI
jgi:hypothetical protein